MSTTAPSSRIQTLTEWTPADGTVTVSGTPGDVLSTPSHPYAAGPGIGLASSAAGDTAPFSPTWTLSSDGLRPSPRTQT